MSTKIKVSATYLLLSALLLSLAPGCDEGVAAGDASGDEGDGGNARKNGDTSDARHHEDPSSQTDSAKSALARVANPSVSNVAALGTDNAKFAFDLYHAVATANEGKNLVFSPYSISTALAMTYAGARGTTESEMKAALHFDLDGLALHEAFNATDLALASRGAGKVGADGSRFRLNVNNSIWAQKDYPVEPAFLDVLALNYGSSVFLADFASAPETARNTINGWVSDKTERLVPELLAPGIIGTDTRFVLTNTIYLNAGWQEKFEKGRTVNTTFTRGGDGGPVTCKLMNADLFIAYAEGENYRAIALPYEDEQLRFVAVLPAEGAFAAVETKLSGAWLEGLNAQWTKTSVDVGLPQLDFQQHTSLVPHLEALGMRAAFENADFSGLTSGSVAIDDVVHQAVLKVFEGGTIAAAATAVVVGETSAIHSERTIRFDRPFLFAIVDKPTGEVLFLGRVLDPTAK